MFKIRIKSKAATVWLMTCLLLAFLPLVWGGWSSPPVSPHTKSIEDIKAGDKVMAYDVKSGQWEAKEVIKPLVHDFTGDMITLRVNGETIQATANHPFWVVSGQGLRGRPEATDVPIAERAALANAPQGRWVPAGKLQLGDQLIIRSGQMATVEEISARQVSQKVYNIEVADLHTYAVGYSGVAVHNKCFLPGTLVVMADGSTKAIEKIERGDMVLALDPQSGEKPIAHKVLDRFENFTYWVYHVKVENADHADGVVDATGTHPFWTQNRGWVECHWLKAGDQLQDKDGRAVSVVGLKEEDRTTPTYNLTVEGVHTYYVTDHGVSLLVHNGTILPGDPLPDGSYVVRGGTNFPPQVAAGSEVPVPPGGTVSGLSTSSYPDATIEQLVGGPGRPYIPNNQIGVTTTEQIRAVGGEVTHTPSANNPFHADVDGLTPDQASNLFRDGIQMNPCAK